MTTEKRNDEIDLIELFLKIYVFFKKHFWFLFICAFIGAGIGYSTKFFTKKHYESTMIMNSNTIPEKFLIEYINNLNSIIKDKNYMYLSKKMMIDSNLLLSINEIKAESAYDEKEKKNLGYVTVSVKVSDNQIIEHLSKGMLNYIADETYVKNETEIFIEQNTALIEKIDEEIKKLEILQTSLSKPVQNSGDVNIYNDQKSFQDELLSLLKEKQSREKLLKFAVPFRIIQDFTIYQKPVRKTVTYTLSGGFIFGFIALFYLIFKNLNKQVKDLE